MYLGCTYLPLAIAMQEQLKLFDSLSKKFNDVQPSAAIRQSNPLQGRCQFAIVFVRITSCANKKISAVVVNDATVNNKTGRGQFVWSTVGNGSYVLTLYEIENVRYSFVVKLLTVTRNFCDIYPRISMK